MVERYKGKVISWLEFQPSFLLTFLPGSFCSSPTGTHPTNPNLSVFCLRWFFKNIIFFLSLRSEWLLFFTKLMIQLKFWKKKGSLQRTRWNLPTQELLFHPLFFPCPLRKGRPKWSVHISICRILEDGAGSRCTHDTCAHRQSLHLTFIHFLFVLSIYYVVTTHN